MDRRRTSVPGAMAVGALLLLSSISLQTQAPAPCSVLSFKGAVSIETGLFASGVAIGDFNVDGAADMAVTNQNSNNVSILLGDGTGALRGKTDLPAGGSPQRIAAADLDGDGKLDLVLPISAANAVAILWGDGKGGFGEPVMFGVGQDPQSMSIADFNGDGFPDIAISNSLPVEMNSTVSVLFGDGTGGFAERIPLEIGRAGRGTGVADFDGDGNLDIVVANSNSNTVSVLLGDGRGRFRAKTDLRVGTNPRKLTVGDLNGDGKADIVTPNTGSNDVSILMNNCEP